MPTRAEILDKMGKHGIGHIGWMRTVGVPARVREALVTDETSLTFHD